MPTAQEITKALFDADGSVRNITFTPVEPQRIAMLLQELRKQFTVRDAFDHDGEDVREVLRSGSIADLWKSSSGYVCSYWHSDTHVIRALQVFISWPETQGTIFVELTFFPSDLVAEGFQLNRFLSIVEDWREVLKADDYYVRYENASWVQFD